VVTVGAITLSVIKADTGGYVGHSAVHPDMLAEAAEAVHEARDTGLIGDGHVSSVGDDIALIMTHTRGENDSEVHGFAWRTFERTTAIARKLGLYAAGQDLLADAFSGNLRGMGPGYCEMSFEERASEPVIVFMADKTEAGAWNYPLTRMFADPFSSAGLVIDEKMHHGFEFEVLDAFENRTITFACPEDYYSMLMLVGAPGRYGIRTVRSRALDTVCAASSTQRLSEIAGRYVGKDDPVLAVRCQSGLPAVGEVLEPFAFPFLVAGWMRGSHHGPLMPCAVADATPSAFDGPPRAVALGFQITGGRLVGPRDLFADVGFDRARGEALRAAEYLRRHGPFEPHRLPMDELEYTTLPAIMKELGSRWQHEPA
jgi:fructose 1,6-bisphosphate aldolase/phosphatase